MTAMQETNETTSERSLPNETTGGGRSLRQKQMKIAKDLMSEKELIEGKIQDFESILRAQKVGMLTPLVDSEGFPRADIDVYQVRLARASLVPLYNDLKGKMAEVEEALILVHATPEDPSVGDGEDFEMVGADVPFARVNGVFPNSPGNVAGLERGDLIIEFGKVSLNSTASGGVAGALGRIGDDLSLNEYKSMKVRLLREGQIVIVYVVPRPWEGREFEPSELKETSNREPNEVEKAINSSVLAGLSGIGSQWGGFLSSVKSVVLPAAESGSASASKGEGASGANEKVADRGTSEMFESALDSLDDSLERAENLALSGIASLGSGFASFFSSVSAGSGSSPGRTTVQQQQQQQTINDRYAIQVLEAGLSPLTYLDPLNMNTSAASSTSNPTEAPEPIVDSHLKERFRKFVDSFDRISHAGRIATIMEQQPRILQVFKDLVPSKVSEEDFWIRYFFRIEELELGQKRRAALLVGTKGKAGEGTTSKGGVIATVIGGDEEVLWSESEEEEDETPVVVAATSKTEETKAQEDLIAAPQEAVEAHPNEGESFDIPAASCKIHAASSQVPATSSEVPEVSSSEIPTPSTEPQHSLEEAIDPLLPINLTLTSSTSNSNGSSGDQCGSNFDIVEKKSNEGDAGSDGWEGWD